MDCRILYIAGRLHTGGLERQLYYLLQSIDRERYRPAVAAWDYREQDFYITPIRKLGVPIHSVFKTPSRAKKLRAFRCLVKKLAPEVVHSYNFYTNFAAFWAVRGTRTVAVGSLRSDFDFAKKEVGLVLGSLSARWPANQICNSSSGAEAIRQSGSPFVPKNTYVVRNGVDLDLFRNSPVPTSGRACIAAVGYLLPTKRWDRLLGASFQLKQTETDCLVQIAGDGPLHDSLEQQAQSLGVADRVRFLGHTDDIPGLLAESICLVHTADTEGCPNAVMEAMACGRAVVAMDAGDISSLVEDGKTGFVIRRGDDARLVKCIMHLVADRELCQRMGKAGRIKAEREFDLKSLTQETLNAYRASGWNDGIG